MLYATAAFATALTNYYLTTTSSLAAAVSALRKAERSDRDYGLLYTKRRHWSLEALLT